MDTGDFKDNKDPPIEVYGGSVEGHSEGVDVTQTTAEPVYRLYKQRFVGLFALVVLNFVSGFLLVWFGPIANDTAHEFGFTLGAVNFTFPPASVAAALVCKRWGVRMTCYVGSALFVVSAWVRYAGTARSLSTSGSLGIMILGQMLGGSAQAMFQVIGPSFSETWFGLKSRTTVTMIIGVANPFGSAIAQIISPLANTVRTSILVLAIICTCAAPLALLMTEAPPTPPTHSASHERPSLMSLIRALGGRESTGQRSYMTVRERMDFFLLTLIGGVLVGVVTSYSLLTAEHFHPYGYSKSAAGLFGATLIIVGLVMAGVTAPLFDRVLTNHLALTLKVACPSLGVLRLSMIWAVKPHDSGALFAICALIGGLSLPILPVFLELAVEVTRNADGSTACLWSAGNLMTVIFVLSENALRAGPNASPPFNMHRAFILQGALTLVATSLVFGIEGKQTRRKLDEQRIQEAKETKEVIQTPII